MAKRVPYCSECEHCDYIFISYYEYYCKLDDDRKQISVDYIPPRSPKWCPKRKENIEKNNS